MDTPAVANHQSVWQAKHTPLERPFFLSRLMLIRVISLLSSYAPRREYSAAATATRHGHRRLHRIRERKRQGEPSVERHTTPERKRRAVRGTRPMSDRRRGAAQIANNTTTANNNNNNNNNTISPQHHTKTTSVPRPASPCRAGPGRWSTS